MPVTYRVQVHHNTLRSEFRRHGESWQDRVTLAMMQRAIRTAPRRNGNLQASHRIERVWGNQWAIIRNIENFAEHASYVHDGTGDLTEKGAVRVLKPYGPHRRHRFVVGSEGKPVLRGQKANPWLEEACGWVSIANGAVRYA